MPSSRDPLSRTLDGLREHRRPFERLSRSLIGELVERHVSATEGPIVEIGAGDGQLLDWLPPEIAGRTLHTEAVASAAGDLARRRPDTAIARAQAEALPIADRSVAAVLGLCVLDVVPDGRAVAREVARVLRPGGHFIHVLDMTTHFAGWFRELVHGGAVPLPNIFFDPSAAHWPEDVFVAPAAQLRRILDILTRAGHPLAPPLREYLALHETVPFPEQRALTELAQLSASVELRNSLRAMFQTAMTLADPSARAELAGYQAVVLSSSRYFERRLRDWFSVDCGFSIVQSDVVDRSEQEPVPRTHAFRYQSLCVGERRTLPAPPEPLRAPRPLIVTLSQQDTVIRELGAFVFVARLDRAQSRTPMPASTAGDNRGIR